MLTRVRVYSSFFGLMLFGLAGTTSVVAQFGTTAATGPNTTTSATTAATTTAATTTTASTTATSLTTTLTSQPQARLIEWDLPAQADASPGAMEVDTMGRDKNRVWVVSRQGLPQATVYRVDFPKSLMQGPAFWTSWKLSSNSLITGGMKKIRASRDRRYVFVRTILSLERIDTQNCSGTPQTCDLAVWVDQDPSDTSDLAVDDWNNVFTTHSVTPADPSSPDLSYVQMLIPRSGYADVYRWVVGGGAGFCMNASGDGSPCLSGIAVNPNKPNLVYYSEPSGGANGDIAELNIQTNTVRRWYLDQLPPVAPPDGTATSVSEPRQLRIDRWGKVWVVTGSGHLVSLDPCTNQMTRHEIPDSVGGNPFGVAPDDDVIGYTATTTNKVGVLFPHGPSFYVCPQTQYDVTPSHMTIPTDTSERSAVNSGCVGPNGKTVAAQYTKKSDGTYIEAEINNVNGDQFPLGITPSKDRAQGTFFYAVGQNEKGTDSSSGAAIADRIGFVRLPILEKIKHPRDDEDRDDGWTGDDSWHAWHNHANSDDDDDDGVPNEYDSPDHENVQRGDATPLPGGAFADYPMAASSTTLALIATAEADDPLAQLGIDILDANGLLIARSVPTPGIAVVEVPLPAAGNYTCRVHNYGPSSVNHTPMLIVREPWLP